MSLISCSRSQVEGLGRSPAFAMSLGAKELFHTNFLAFLLEDDDLRLEEVRLALRNALGFPPAVDAVSTCVVWREKRNLDLVIVELKPVEKAAVSPIEPTDNVLRAGWDWVEDDGWVEQPLDQAAGEIAPGPALVRTGRVVIVEAKLKSIPLEAQLREYDAALRDRAIVLSYPEDGSGPDWVLTVGGSPKGGNATITRRLLSIDGSALAGWDGVSWRAVQIAIADAAELIDPELEFKQLLRDYATSLGALLTIAERVGKLYVAGRANEQVPYGALYAQVANQRFRSLRVMDLYGKQLFSCWLSDLLHNFSQQAASPGWQLEGYVHFSRGIPGLGVEWRKAKWTDPAGQPNQLRIGVQVQGTEVRAYVSTERVCAALETWLQPSGLWQGWFLQQVFEASWMGYRGNPVQIGGADARRLTNLKVFDPNKFVYGSAPIAAVPFMRLEAEIVRLIGIARQLTPQL